MPSNLESIFEFTLKKTKYFFKNDLDETEEEKNKIKGKFIYWKTSPLMINNDGDILI